MALANILEPNFAFRHIILALLEVCSISRQVGIDVRSSLDDASYQQNVDSASVYFPGESPRWRRRMSSSDYCISRGHNETDTRHKCSADVIS
jgi:hypothetical protein